MLEGLLQIRLDSAQPVPSAFLTHLGLKIQGLELDYLVRHLLLFAVITSRSVMLKPRFNGLR